MDPVFADHTISFFSSDLTYPAAARSSARFLAGAFKFNSFGALVEMFVFVGFIGYNRCRLSRS